MGNILRVAVVDHDRASFRSGRSHIYIVRERYVRGDSYVTVAAAANVIPIVGVYVYEWSWSLGMYTYVSS